MRRFLTAIRTPGQLQEFCVPYTNGDYRILCAPQGSDVVVAVYKLTQAESSLQGLQWVDDLSLLEPYPIDPPIPKGKMCVSVDGTVQVIDKSTLLDEWRRKNSHYYPYRSKLDVCRILFHPKLVAQKVLTHA